MKRFLPWCALLFLSASPLAFGHGVNFFEYAPDPWQSRRLVVSAADTPSQTFQLGQDAILQSFDLWMDNLGESGSITFTLLDDQNTTLATKVKTISALPAVPGGNKLHIDLNSTVVVEKNKPYTIRITPQETMLGLGLYYANRITFLEHNQDYASDYSNGAAKLGSEEQNYSFKFALYAASGGSGSTLTEDEEQPNSSSTSPMVFITNARVVNTTYNSVTLAWTTNIAADSRVTIRTQLDPLYVYASGFDPTLELEHTITIGGLTQNADYFADVFSQQGDALLLSTYTIAFHTPKPTAEELVAQQTQNQPAQPAQQPTQPATPNNQPATNNPTANQPATNSTPSNQPTSNQNQSALPALNFGSGSRSGNFSVSWQTPAGGAPETGWRIDIFDADKNLERQFYLPSKVTEKDIAALPAGEHTAIVYANDNGTFTKVATPAVFSIKSQVAKHIWISIALAVLFFGGTSWLVIWWFMREKSPLPEIEE